MESSNSTYFYKQSHLNFQRHVVSWLGVSCLIRTPNQLSTGVGVFRRGKNVDNLFDGSCTKFNNTIIYSLRKPGKTPFNMYWTLDIRYIWDTSGHRLREASSGHRFRFRCAPRRAAFAVPCLRGARCSAIWGVCWQIHLSGEGGWNGLECDLNTCQSGCWVQHQPQDWHAFLHGLFA